MKSTSFLTKEEALKQRKWLLIDAKGKPLGRLASQIAVFLRGKHKPTFTPHTDCGDFVVVINAKDVVLTGGKLKKKKYFWHSGYVGGIKSRSAEETLNKEPSFLIKNAVKGMLPRGPLGRALLKKLKVYEGEEHPHKAQKPKKISC